MRRAAKVDRNQPEIVAALRKVGCAVIDLSPVGQGVPDLLVGTRSRRWVLLEIKDGEAFPSDRKLTPAQVAFHAKHAEFPLVVVESVDEALAAVA